MRMHAIVVIAAVALIACAHWAVAGNAADRRADAEDGWHVVHRGAMAIVEVEKALYEKPGERHFFVHVRVRNTTNQPITADLRNDPGVVYPNQWGPLDEAKRGDINEEHRKYEPLNDARRAEVLKALNAHKLTAIAPSKSIDYYRAFNASTRGDVEKRTARHRFLFISLDGEQIVTDGEKVEQVSCGWGVDKPADVATDVFLPVPLPWKTIPDGGTIISDTSATTRSSSTIVGSVYGKAITATDIGLTEPIDPAVQFDSRDTAKWALMERVIATFGNPIVERFVAEKKFDATADEIEAFRRTLRKSSEQQARETEERLATVKADLASKDLRDEDKAKLEKDQAMLEKTLLSWRETAGKDAPDDAARRFIIAWKIERELHRVYGGRVIFQQAGPEALDARRLLFEQAEKNGDLKFDDVGVRQLFYHYANMKHTVMDESALERPWFLGEPK
jgi:hypothetical protein